jgi:maltose alpha-D-glucosyltransferase/alpha-amylase
MDAIIYEMHVKAFRDSNHDGFGDFRGLTEKLDYLERLGVNCIWLLPFYPSPLRDDGYDISLYEGIHDNYGSLRDFRRFVREAHRRGLRVITELVLNHTSDQHPWFQAARRAQPGSSKWNFYVWSDTGQRYPEARVIFVDSETSNWTWDPVAKSYFWHRFFHHQPDLNFDNPAVVRAIIKVMRFWLDLGVDGLRLDAVPYLVEREGTHCENLEETHAILKKLRHELDLLYEDKIFLAEANQWPADVRPYFGAGDECHIAYHFPLMPRIFMALRQEDRHPIVEILAQTPEIPDNCQWALFLRNHDELTLEMVTDEERDYMYGEYAKDPLMRLNVGIRRRLMPLLDGNRRQYELLHSLLMSLKGTPVIYYGDELGMGDNIYLGDRDGVRTPMQWTGDRNAGFSETDAARLYSPVISDPVFGYQAVNVEAQERLSTSLLSWMQSLIRVRKQSKAFGRGSLRMLEPENRKVLVYLREYRDETLLIVNNLSRQAQAVEIDLLEFAGRVPVELFGNSAFPGIGELPYLLTLGPYGFYWFRLAHAGERPQLPPRSKPRVQEDVPVLTLEGRRADATSAPVLEAMESSLLIRFLLEQPWFDGSARTPRSARVAEVIPVALGGECAALARLDVRFSDAVHESYLVVLMAAENAPESAIVAGAVLAQLRCRDGDGLLFDAAHDARFQARLLEIVRAEPEIASEDGARICIRLTEGGLDLPEQVASRLLDDEPVEGSPPLARLGEASASGAGSAVAAAGAGLVPQSLDAGDEPERSEGAEWGHGDRTLALPRFRRRSQTSIVYGERLLLKLYRRLEPGLHPEVEMLEILGKRPSFTPVPPLVARFTLESGDATYEVGVLRRFVPDVASLWSLARRDLDEHFLAERVPLRRNGFVDTAARLGGLTRRLHETLAERFAETSDAARPANRSDLEQWGRRVRRLVSHTLHELNASCDDGALPAKLYRDARAIVNRSTKAADRVDHLISSFGAQLGIVTRVHGRYRLQDVLRTPDGELMVVGFEGDPTLLFGERRRLESPLRDAASMLRSFAYVATEAVGMHVDPATQRRAEERADQWERSARTAFLRGYMGERRAAPSPVLPPRRDAVSKLLTLFEIEALFGELHDQIVHDPERVGLPLKRIRTLLDL